MRGIEILHEDADVIVVDKAAGILSQALRGGGAYCVEDALSDYVRKGQTRSRKRVWLVHRLDRDTSGVMVVAKSEEVREYFRSQWNEITEKTYLARVAGTMERDEGVFESVLAEDPATLKVRSVSGAAARNGKPARTEWRVISRDAGRGSTLVEARLKTGRKNQIRVHFSEAGHPVLGDSKYGGPAAARLCLHAWKLAFVHPHCGRRMDFESPPPPILAPRT